jgi:hypothetical protein
VRDYGARLEVLLRQFNLEILNGDTAPTDPSLPTIPWWVRIVMPHNFKSDAIQECYLRAAEARRIAEAATDPLTKVDFFALERRWLALARSYQSEERRQFATPR